MGTENAKDAQASHHVTTMGPELGPLFHTLVQQTFRLHTLFDEHETLFGDRTQVELLNQAAGSFFYLVDYALWESVLLSISRLTDAAATGRAPRAFVNVTIRRERDRRQAALLNLISSMRPAQPVEVILPPSRPTTTNCARVLNEVSCTTR